MSLKQIVKDAAIGAVVPGSITYNFLKSKSEPSIAIIGRKTCGFAFGLADLFTGVAIPLNIAISYMDGSGDLSSTMIYSISNLVVRGGVNLVVKYGSLQDRKGFAVR